MKTKFNYLKLIILSFSLFINYCKLFKLILSFILNLSIKYIKIFKSKYYILSINYINFNSFYLIFNPNICYSLIYKAILKNDIPKEKTSDNSGLNSPVPNPYDIYNISGDI